MRNSACSYRTICVFIFLSFAFHWSSAQTGTVKGIVKDPEGKPIQYANVLLLKSSDSSLVKGMVSDASGNYFFENIQKGEYFITASFITTTRRAPQTDLRLAYLTVA